MQSSQLQALGIVDCVVLQKQSEIQYTLLHGNDVWLPLILPAQNEGDELTLEQGASFSSGFPT